jgi:hypothetical protein
MANPHFVPFDTYVCKNCENEFNGIVCNHCGQHPVTSRLSLKTLWKEWRERRKFDGSKLFKTFISLFLRPGAVIRGYLDGKRHSYYNAVNFFLLAASLIAFATLQFNTFNMEEAVEGMKKLLLPFGYPEEAFENNAMLEYIAWVRSHMNLILLASLPVMALSSWILFRKRGFSLGEHLIMHCYAYGFSNMIMIPAYVFGNPMAIGSPFQMILSVVFVIWYTWVYKDLFNMALWKSFILVIIWYILYFILIMVISLVLGIAIGFLAAIVIIGLKKIGLLG